MTHLLMRLLVQARIVEADVLRPGSLPQALQGIEVAYYLIHSMGGGHEGFEERDRRAAQNFADNLNAELEKIEKPADISFEPSGFPPEACSTSIISASAPIGPQISPAGNRTAICR